jgi:hypothetical protein
MSTAPAESAAKESKRKFRRDAKTKHQERNNDKVLMQHWANRRREYSVGHRKRYRKLRRELPMAGVEKSKERT